jgi:hypothetical protein
VSRQELGKWDGSAFTQRAHTLPLFCSGIAHITAAAICSRHARAGAIALHACFQNCADVSEKKLAVSGSQGRGSRCGSCIRSLLAVVGNSSQNCRHAQKNAQTAISDRVNQSGKHEHVFIFFSKSGHKMKRLHPVIVQSALPS